MMRRATLFGGLLALLLAPGRVMGFWRKKARAALPSGGTIAVPPGYLAVLPGQYNHEPEAQALIAYRNYHSTGAGSRECDGMIAISTAKDHESLEKFGQQAHAALTTDWSYASLKPGWFGGKHESYPKVKVDGPSGPELHQELMVHLVGFWDVYDKPGRMYAVNHKGGLMIAVWIFDSHGGIQTARRLADEITGSWVA